MYFSRRGIGKTREYVVEPFFKNPIRCYNNYGSYGKPVDKGHLFLVSFDQFNTCNITGGKRLGTHKCIRSALAPDDDYSVEFDNVNLQEGEMYYVVGE